MFFINCREEVPESKGAQNPDLKTDRQITIPNTNTLGVLKYENKTLDGYILFTIHKDTYLIDRCGRVVNHWISDHDFGGSFQLLEDGSLLRAGKIENKHIDFPGIGGIIEKFNWQGKRTWYYTISDSLITQHHGLLQLPNGNIALTAVKRMRKEEVINAGRNPETIPDGELYDEQIIEISPTGNNQGEVVWEWHAWDHLIQDYDPAKRNYGSVKQNPHRIDINFLGISSGATDWLHLNSLAYNAELDQIMIGSQKLSEIYIIDHSTTTREASGTSGGRSGKGGDILYRWGNPLAYGYGDSQNRKLFGPHFAHWIPKGLKGAGNIMIYNNGLGRKANYSSVDIIIPEIDPQGRYRLSDASGYLPEQPAWTYKNIQDSTLFYSKIMSSAQRLPNGNTFICEGTKGKLFEIDEAGEIVWEYVNPVSTKGKIFPQGEKTQSHLFIALYYGKDFPGFKNKNLIPGKPIELDYNIGNCQ